MVIDGGVCLREREGICVCFFLSPGGGWLGFMTEKERNMREGTNSPTYHCRWIERWMVEICFKDPDCLVRTIRWVPGFR